MPHFHHTFNIIYVFLRWDSHFFNNFITLHPTGDHRTGAVYFNPSSGRWNHAQICLFLLLNFRKFVLNLCYIWLQSWIWGSLDPVTWKLKKSLTDSTDSTDSLPTNLKAHTQSLLKWQHVLKAEYVYVCSLWMTRFFGLWKRMGRSLWPRAEIQVITGNVLNELILCGFSMSISAKCQTSH